MTLYDLRSDVEEVKWDNMRKSVGELNFVPFDGEPQSHLFSYTHRFPLRNRGCNGAPLPTRETIQVTHTATSERIAQLTQPTLPCGRL